MVVENPKYMLSSDHDHIMTVSMYLTKPLMVAWLGFLTFFGLTASASGAGAAWAVLTSSSAELIFFTSSRCSLRRAVCSSLEVSIANKVLVVSVLSLAISAF